MCQNDFTERFIRPMSTITAESPWRTTAEVTEYLKVARQTLNRNMDRFSYGVHYFRKDPGNNKSQLIWHLENVEKFFLTPVSYKRKTN